MKYEYNLEESSIQRVIRAENGRTFCSEIKESDLPEGISFNENDDYFKRWLQCTRRPEGKDTNGEIRVVDLFCGCGGLSLGIEEACRALEYKFAPVLGADMAPAAFYFPCQTEGARVHFAGAGERFLCACESGGVYEDYQ